MDIERLRDTQIQETLDNDSESSVSDSDTDIFQNKKSVTSGSYLYNYKEANKNIHGLANKECTSQSAQKNNIFIKSPTMKRKAQKEDKRVTPIKLVRDSPSTKYKLKCDWGFKNSHIQESEHETSSPTRKRQKMSSLDMSISPAAKKNLFSPEKSFKSLRDVSNPYLTQSPKKGARIDQIINKNEEAEFKCVRENMPLRVDTTPKKDCNLASIKRENCEQLKNKHLLDVTDSFIKGYTLSKNCLITNVSPAKAIRSALKKTTKDDDNNFIGSISETGPCHQNGFVNGSSKYKVASTPTKTRLSEDSSSSDYELKNKTPSKNKNGGQYSSNRQFKHNSANVINRYSKCSRNIVEGTLNDSDNESTDSEETLSHLKSSSNVISQKYPKKTTAKIVSKVFSEKHTDGLCNIKTEVSKTPLKLSKPKEDVALLLVNHCEVKLIDIYSTKKQGPSCHRRSSKEDSVLLKDDDNNTTEFIQDNLQKRIILNGASSVVQKRTRTKSDTITDSSNSLDEVCINKNTTPKTENMKSRLEEDLGLRPKIPRKDESNNHSSYQYPLLQSDKGAQYNKKLFVLQNIGSDTQQFVHGDIKKNTERLIEIPKRTRTKSISKANCENVINDDCNDEPPEPTQNNLSQNKEGTVFGLKTPSSVEPPDLNTSSYMMRNRTPLKTIEECPKLIVRSPTAKDKSFTKHIDFNKCATPNKSGNHISQAEEHVAYKLRNRTPLKMIEESPKEVVNRTINVSGQAFTKRLDFDKCATPSKIVNQTYEEGQSLALTPSTPIEAKQKLKAVKTPLTNKNITVTTPVSKKKEGRGFLTPNMAKRDHEANDTADDALDITRKLLHISTVPKSLPCRDSEFNLIKSFLLRKIEHSAGGCMYISGVPGTGKTATVHAVIRSLQEDVTNCELPDFDFVEINGLRLTEPRQAYVRIYQTLTNQKVTADQAQQYLNKRFSSNCKKPTIILVDELDYLCNRRQDVVYNILDWPSKRGSALAVLTISNTMDLPERTLKGRVTSRMGLTRLTFQPYTHHQLREIVQDRLSGSSAFHPDAIQLAARKVAAVSGDARRALDVCRRTTELARHSGGQVTVSHVEQALTQLCASARVQAIRALSGLGQLVLRSVRDVCQRTGVDETTADAVYLHLRQLAQLEGVLMPSTGSLLETCVRLVGLGLLVAEKGRPDLTRKMSLNVSSDDIHYALDNQQTQH